MISSLVCEYNNLSKIHFIKRAKLRNKIYEEVLKECSSYKEFSEKCPIPFDEFELIGLCMSKGKTVPTEQQNWYMSEKQKRALDDVAAEVRDARESVKHVTAVHNGQIDSFTIW